MRILSKMPDVESLKTDVVDMSGRLPGAIAFKWEIAPGTPISEATAAITEPCRTPIRPPPGGGSARNSFVNSRSMSGSTFQGFAPETENPKPKMFKKLAKLRKMSSSAAACFHLDAFRYLLDKRDFHSSNGDVDVERYYDSDEYSVYSTSNFDQSETPSSSCSSLGSKSSGSTSTSRDAPPTAPQPVHQLRSNMLLYPFPMDDGEDNDDSGGGATMLGPRESAWHQPQAQELTHHEWPMVRRSGHLHERTDSMISSHSSCISTRNLDHSVKYSMALARGGSTRRSSTLLRLLG